MSQTNINTGDDNNNRNQHAGRGVRGQGGFGDLGCGVQGDHRNYTITIWLFEGKMKDGRLNKLVIIECSHRATLFKKIHDVLAVLCADKG